MPRAQIALFVFPLCVVIGWAYDIPLSMDLHPFETEDHTLRMHAPICIACTQCTHRPARWSVHGVWDRFETATLLMTVLLVGILIQTGESHWLNGFVLICAYVVISIGACTCRARTCTCTVPLDWFCLTARSFIL